MIPSNTPHNIVCFGEILWDILPAGTQPGGAPMNVAYHLKKLGSDPALITKIGIDDLGKKLVNILSASGVSTEFFQVDYDHPTGIVHANPNEHNEVVYEIVFPVAWDFIQWDEEFTSLMGKAEYFLFGSLTSRNKVSRDTLYRLLEMAKTKILDINLRPPHFSRAHVEYLLNKADILKVNIHELELITGWFSEFQLPEDRTRVLQERFNIETIIVTLGGDGAMVNCKGAIHQHPGFSIQVADTIGSGDAFLAGFVHQLSSGYTAEKALEYACGLGALIATYNGACPAYQVQEVETLMWDTASQKLNTNF
jgi:fructokinase